METEAGLRIMNLLYAFYYTDWLEKKGRWIENGN